MDKLEQPEYDKAVGQFRLQLNGVMKPFNMYGFQELVPGAIEQITALTELFGERIRGKDVPLTLDYAKQRIEKKHKEMK
jgi:hypothetical protein